MKSLKITFAIMGLLLGVASQSRSDIIAYDLPRNINGNQGAFSGSIGLDFNVGSSLIEVTQLGVFDSLGNGFAAGTTLTVILYDRGAPSKPALVSLEFTAADPGVLAPNSAFRFKSLATPLRLGPGRQLTIVAQGFNTNDRNYNRNEPNGSTPITFSGNGIMMVSDTTGNRFGPANQFPVNLDGGPSPRYGAGSLMYNVIPEPSSVILTGIGTVGLVALGYRRRRNAA